MVKSILKEKFHKPFRDTLLLLISSELNFANFAGIKFCDLAIKKMLKETKFREIPICINKLLVLEFAQLISLYVALVSSVSEQLQPPEFSGPAFSSSSGVVGVDL